MKKIYSIIIASLIGINLFAQAPQKISYQAVILDNTSNLVSDTKVGMRISILEGNPGGNSIYTETHNPTTSSNGLASIEIGNGTVVKGDFSTINWSSGPFFIKTETDPTGGSNYTISGVSQLMSVPYALHAKTAERIIGDNGSNGSSRAVTSSRYVGELYGGGVVVAVWKVNGVEKGLIASLSDVSPSAQWSNKWGYKNDMIGNAAKNAFDGKGNTNAIIAQVGHTKSAAKLCKDFRGGNYSDWYLPSVWELSLCYNAAPIVNRLVSDGFKFEKYWSSTEGTEAGSRVMNPLPWDAKSIYSFDFQKGSSDQDKTANDALRVRAVRTF